MRSSLALVAIWFKNISIKEMKIVTLLLVFLCYFFNQDFVSAQLKVGFYSSSCPTAENIVKSVVKEKFKSDHSITGALLRLHFHDCGVRVRI